MGCEGTGQKQCRQTKSREPNSLVAIPGRASKWWGHSAHVQACGTGLGGSGKQEPYGRTECCSWRVQLTLGKGKQIKRRGADGSSKCCVGGGGEEEKLRPQNSILQAGKDSSCITTVLLLAKTMIFSSCCFSCVCWYHSRITSVSCVGIRVTWGNKRCGPHVKRLEFLPVFDNQRRCRFRCAATFCMTGWVCVWMLLWQSSCRPAD